MKRKEHLFIHNILKAVNEIEEFIADLSLEKFSKKNNIYVNYLIIFF